MTDNFNTSCHLGVAVFDIFYHSSKSFLILHMSDFLFTPWHFGYYKIPYLIQNFCLICLSLIPLPQKKEKCRLTTTDSNADSLVGRNSGFPLGIYLHMRWAELFIIVKQEWEFRVSTRLLLITLQLWAVRVLHYCFTASLSICTGEEWRVASSFFGKCWKSWLSIRLHLTSPQWGGKRVPS